LTGLRNSSALPPRPFEPFGDHGGGTADVRKGSFDASAIGVLALCMAHCAALPLIAASLPAAATWMGSELVHFLFVAMATPLSIVTLAGRGTRRFLITAIIGLVLLLTGAVLHAHGILSILLTLAGGAVIVTAHTLNWRQRETPASRA